jgi:hypothetical protein
VLGILAVIVPRWAGIAGVTEVCDQLAILLPLIFTGIGMAQKWADGKSQGETSGYNRYLKEFDKRQP